MSTGGERRRHPRAPIAASAVLLKGEQRLGSYRVINLSAGGLLLAGEAPPEGPETLRVSLRVGGDATLKAQVALLRQAHAHRAPSFALSFVDLDADAEDMIQNAVLEALEQATTASVLVVDDSPEICHALRLQLSRLGHRSYTVGTPLEAVDYLEQPNQVSVALVDLVLCGSNGLDVLAYLAEQHPGVRRVLMSGRAQPGQLELARHSLFKFSAHDVLAKPWTDGALTRAIAL
jgi:CheY-like chemotaxis protein